jgi:hypothetical protein
VDVGGAGLDSPPEQRCVSAKGAWGGRSAAPRWNFGLSGMGTGAMEAWKAGRGRAGFFFTMGAHVMNFIEWHGDTSDERGSRRFFFTMATRRWKAGRRHHADCFFHETRN